MTEVNIIVPHDRIAFVVRIDGMNAQKMVTHTPPGFGYDIETWQAPENGKGYSVVIEFGPR